jgi:hypothetical protein
LNYQVLLDSDYLFNEDKYKITMDEPLRIASTSPVSSMVIPQYLVFLLAELKPYFYLVLSEFSSHDSVVNPGIFSPLRPSFTWADMSDLTNSLYHQHSFDEFNSQRSSGMSRW